MLRVGERLVQVLSGEENTIEGGTLRRLLLLAALCMVAALAFVAPAVAQSPDEPCPADLDQFPPGTVCGEGGGYVTSDASASSSASATASASADPCPDPDFPRETPDGCQASDLPDVEFGSATPTATATAEADDDGSASASASALPDTGGVASPAALSLMAALLLVGGGIVSASIIRRR